MILTLLALALAGADLPTSPVHVIAEHPGGGSYVSEPEAVAPGRWRAWSWAVVSTTAQPDAVYGFHTEYDCPSGRIRRLRLTRHDAGREAMAHDVNEPFRPINVLEIEDDILPAICRDQLGRLPTTASIDAACARAAASAR